MRGATRHQHQRRLARGDRHLVGIQADRSRLRAEAGCRSDEQGDENVVKLKSQIHEVTSRGKVRTSRLPRCLLQSERPDWEL